MTEQFFIQWCEHLAARLVGPLSFRFVVQPIVAAGFAVRAGLRDARADRLPYLWHALYDRPARRVLLHEGWRDIKRLACVAFLVDVVYQLIVLRWIRPLQALLVAFALAVAPYALLRGPMNRVVAWIWRWRARRLVQQ